jgi:hypothetical protein
MLVAEVHGRERAADLGLCAGGNRLCLSCRTGGLKPLLAKLEAVVAMRHSMLASGGACPYVPGYRHNCVCRRVRGLQQSARDRLVFVA